MIIYAKLRNTLLFPKELMLLLRMVLCEDNCSYAIFLKTTIENLCKNQPDIGKIVSISNSSSDIEVFLKTNKANVFLLDIDLKSEKNGLDIAREIREFDENAYIVFISQHTQQVFDSFKLKPFDFIPKPSTKEYIEDLIKRIYLDFSKNITKNSENTLQIKIGSKIHYLPTNEVLYIEKQDNKCIIHSKNSEVYCYDTLESILNKIPTPNFIRTHRSFIVNSNFIKKIDLKALEIILKNDETCFIGGKYKKNLLHLTND